jgi:hypothetical protein
LEKLEPLQLEQHKKLLELQRASEPIQQILIVLFGKACNEWPCSVVISHPKHTKGKKFQ